MTAVEPRDLLIIHRDYRYRGGEEAFLDDHLLPELDALDATYDLLRLPALGVTARDAEELATMAAGLERVRPSYHIVREALDARPYRAALFSNFIPTVSLAAPALCRERGLRVFHWTHNSRLACANGISFDGRGPCSACFDEGSTAPLSPSRHCFPTRGQAALYSTIYRSRRVPEQLLGSIDEWIVSADYSAKQLARVANALGKPLVTRTIRMMPPARSEVDASATIDAYISAGEYFLFVGRLSYEKGADRVVDLARRFSSTRFAVAGKGPMADEIAATAPPNLTSLGFVSDGDRTALIAHARALLIPSRAPENSPVILFESHFAKTPVYYVRGGGAEETTRWLGRDGRDLDAFDPMVALERRGRDFRGDELRSALAALLEDVRGR